MLMFSATLPNQILEISAKYLNKPARISIKDNDVIEVNIKQQVVNLTPKDKHKEFRSYIDRFKNTKINEKTISSEKNTDPFVNSDD